MAIASVSTTKKETTSAPRRPPISGSLGVRRSGRLRSDLAAVTIYTLGAIYITFKLWMGISTRVTASNTEDHAFFQFVFSHAAYALLNWSNPLFNGELNAPFGVNMMANTSMLGISLPLAPVTLLVGPKPAVALATVIGLAGTATAWYYFMLRHVTSRWLCAFVSAGFIGFAPGMVSQANAHPNLVAQFMVPLIISNVIRLREPGPLLGRSLLLGVMAAYQVFINEEVLLFTALACAVLVAVFSLSRPAQSKQLLTRYLRGLGMAASLTLVLTAYPLWFQFAGPQHYTGPFTWAANFGADMAAFTNYARESIGGSPDIARHLAQNPSEENAFYGWPLCALAIAFGVAYWRELAIRLAFVSGAVFAACSLGEELVVNGSATGIPAPWRLVSSLPLFDVVIVTRMAILVAPAIAIILVIAADKLIPVLSSIDARQRKPVYILIGSVLVMAMLPLAPTPLPIHEPRPVPIFISQGGWRSFITHGTVYPAAPLGEEALKWLVSSNMEIPIADGYFIGPVSRTNPIGDLGPSPQRTRELLLKTAKTGEAPVITDRHRWQALADLADSRADVVVLGSSLYDYYLYKVINELLNIPGRRVDDVWLWDVRPLVGSRGSTQQQITNATT